MKQYVVSIMTRDRVGVIADVSSVIKNLGGNLGDLSQTVLCSYFTMILTVSFPDEVTAENLRAALLALDKEDPFEVGIKVLAGPASGEPDSYDEQRFVLTAVGPDRMGLVAAVTQYLRHKGINIEDLATRLDQGRYTMILQLNIPPETNLAHLKRGLDVAMADLGVSVQLQHHGIFRATNEI